nr:L10-interacting MYB domain-containing protein-like [Tanacetum cinerariifolium]
MMVCPILWSERNLDVVYVALRVCVLAQNLLCCHKSRRCDIKSILTHIEVKGYKVEKKECYNVVLSDGSFCKECQISSEINELIRSKKMQQGSIVQLTNFTITSSLIFIVNLKVIRSKCDIIDNKPFTCKKTPSSGITKPPIRDLDSCSQTQRKNRNGQSSDNIAAAAKDTTKDESMTMEKNKDDDIVACFEKLEKIGWGTEDPLYDTALILFVESAEYRKLWLLLKPESCEKWVKNVGSKLGLFG